MTTTYFVSRHPGAWRWAEEEGISFDRHVEHLDPQVLVAGDVVIGTLPVPMAAEVCARGGRYLHLVLDMPAAARGEELTATDLRAMGAHLAEYRAEQVTGGRDA